MPGRSGTGAIPNDMYKFSGKELDEEGGLDWYYFGARYYDPAIGRWGSVDPLYHSVLDMTPYHYTHNNPMNRSDPTGMVDMDALMRMNLPIFNYERHGGDYEQEVESIPYNPPNEETRMIASPSEFYDSKGNKILKTPDGSKDKFIIKDEMQFLMGIVGLVKRCKLRDAGKNAELGKKYGYNVKDGRYPGYNSDDNLSYMFQNGYNIGYSKSSLKAFFNAFFMGFVELGEGGSVVESGYSRGREDFDNGDVHAFNPELINTVPRIDINILVNAAIFITPK